MTWRTMLAGGWRRFRRLPWWGQAGGAVVALAVLTAPLTDQPAEQQVATKGAPASSGDDMDEPTTTTTAAPTTTTTEPPTTTTAAPTTTTTAAPTTTTTAAPTTTTTRRAAATTTTTRPKATTTTAAKAASSSGCHSSYTRTCIPPNVSDADCAGGSGDGPHYVREKNIGVVGPDVFDLDRDGDGVGCES